MRKKFLQEAENGMSVAAAREMASAIVQREIRGPGDLSNAMRRIEQRHGIPYGLLWGLRYRPPKDIMLGAYNALRRAYRTECARQARLLEHELKMAEAAGNDLDDALVEKVENLVRKVKEAKK
ncbi:hypothetical protein [Stappia indica]|uniref:hypothetical protein n=1 Tax=Stappia indica TaxID=538381 RepID=UPI001CD1E417|nr:hypothetical protein [Stappia indica]MCA1298014.1 hypothetical protein [Stappia indica]